VWQRAAVGTEEALGPLLFFILLLAVWILRRPLRARNPPSRHLWSAHRWTTAAAEGNASDPAPPLRLPTTSAVRALASCEGGSLAVGTAEGAVDVWKVGTDGRWARVQSLPHGAPVMALHWSPAAAPPTPGVPTGTRLVSGGMDRVARVWDPTSGHEVAALAGHGGWTRAISGDADHLHTVGCGQGGEGYF